MPPMSITGADRLIELVEHRFPVAGGLSGYRTDPHRLVAKTRRATTSLDRTVSPRRGSGV